MKTRNLDSTQAAFRQRCSDQNARRYRDVLLEYWEDDMIGDETLLAGLKEIRDSELVG